MRSLIRSVFAVLILMMGAFTLPATAGPGGVQPAVLTSDADSGRFLPAAFKTNIRDFKRRFLHRPGGSGRRHPGQRVVRAWFVAL